MRGLIAVVVVVVLVAEGCGGAGGEELIEQLAEASGADDVEVDISDDGSSISVDTDEGTFAIGSGVDVPDGLTYPLPDGGDVTTAGSDGSYVFAAVQYPIDRYDEIVDLYTEWTSADDGEWELIESTTEISGDIIRSAQWVSGPSAIVVNDCASLSGEFDAVCVTLNQSG